MEKIDEIIKEKNKYEGMACKRYHKISDTNDFPILKWSQKPTVYILKLIKGKNKDFPVEIKSIDTAYYDNGSFYYTNSSRVVVYRRRKFGTPIAKKYNYWQYPSLPNNELENIRLTP